jgi:hypothetical protein
VSFHGYDGSHAFRGIAWTDDFERGSFVVDDPDQGVPSDAFLDRKDALGFREQWAAGGPVGPGAGTIVAEGDRLYSLSEFPDVSLQCTSGQNWDLGLFRSSSTSSTSWEPFPGGNPIVRSSQAPEADGKAVGCNIPYPSLFQDPADDAWYLMHGRMGTDPAHNALYVYRLVPDHSLLVNGDFASGDTRGWSRLAGVSTNVAAPRTPNASPDGTSYLAFNCGASPCPPGQSLYQDVAVEELHEGEAIRFGGEFRSESGSGSLEVALHQLDANGGLIRTDELPVSATGNYTPVQQSGAVQAGTRKLRFEIYAVTPETFGADNLFLSVGS